MGNTDSLPVVSQIKSTVQLISGDSEGAAQTQVNFVRQCPVVSQITSTVQVVTGDVDGALETQKQCGKGLLNMADGIPVVGHAKGIIHYAIGDNEGGHQAMKAATRTSGVLAGGAAGFLVGGPVGAIGGGIYGGAVMDTGTSAITGKPSGYYAAIGNAIDNPNAGDLFDLAVMPVADGFAGYGAGKMVQKVQAGNQIKANDVKADALQSQAFEMMDKIENSKGNHNSMSLMNEYAEAQKLFKESQALKGKTNVYVDPKVGGKLRGATKATISGEGAIIKKDIKTSNEQVKTNEKEEETYSSQRETSSKSHEIFYSQIRTDEFEMSMSEITRDMTLESICLDTLSFFEIDTSTTQFKSLVSLLEIILKEEFSLIIETFKNISQINLVEIENIYYLFVVYKTNAGQKGFPLLRNIGREYFKKLKNKLKILAKWEVLQILRIIFDDPKIGEAEEKEPSDQGEHVINKDVLKIYPKIIDRYLEKIKERKNLKEIFQNKSSSRVLKSYLKPIKSPYDGYILDVMKVFVEEYHLDANSVIYGRTVEYFREKVATMMFTTPQNKNILKQEIRGIVKLMNEGEVYVDQRALKLWLKQGGKRSFYDGSLKEVQFMLGELGKENANEPLMWVKEIQGEINANP